MQLGFYTYPTGNRIQSTANGQYNSGISMTYGQWNHLFATFDGSSLKTYINGTLVNTKAITNAQLVRANLTIGARCRGSSYDCFFSGKINDVRIYDHCLSAAEVHEISQGLVLHYKLDGGINGNENFILASHKITSGGDASGITRTYMADDSLKVVAASGNSNWCSIGFAKNSNDNVGAKLAVGDTYTISCDVKVENGTTLPTVFINSGNSYKRLQGTIIQNQWIRAYYTNTWADPGTGYGNISLHLGFSGIVGTYYFKNFKLEKSSFPTVWSPAPADGGVNLTQIQDSSGYGHNGTITGNLSLNSDSPRYNNSIKFEPNNYITHPALCTMYQATYSFWLKEPSFTAYGAFYQSLGNPSTGKVPWFSANTESASLWTYFGGNSPNYTKGTGTLSTNTWYHCTYVWNNGVAQWYLNGAACGNSVTYTGKTYIENGVTCTLGDSYTGTSWNGTPFSGYLSDFRIYCTALSADDIKQLYHTAAKVDNLGGLHTFELNENSGNEPNAKFVNSSATSVSYDAVTDTYTIISPVGTSSWGYGVRLADTPALWVPYGKAYRWTAEVFVPIALTVNTDYNNTASTTWSGNDNDSVSARLAQSNAIPANTWTRITRGSINTNTNNTSQLPIRDYSSLGLVTNGQSSPVTWKVRNLQWYLIEDTFETKIKKTGQTKSSHFSEMNFNKFDISKKNHSIESFNFIER